MTKRLAWGDGIQVRTAFPVLKISETGSFINVAYKGGNVGSQKLSSGNTVLIFLPSPCEGARELDEDVAEANDQRRNKNISELKACPFCKGSDRPFLFVDEDYLKIHILRFHTGYPINLNETQIVTSREVE